MPLPPATDLDIAGSTPAGSARPALAAARATYYEDPAGALAVAIRCYELASSAGDDELCARASALQGMVSLHRGDLRGALALAVEAERHSEGTPSAAAQAEVAALRAQLSFFTGSYTEALRHAELAVERADSARDLRLRVYARRATCPVFGNVGVPDLRQRVEKLLALAIESGDPWEESISRNDLACSLQWEGDLEGAARELERALEAARRVEGANSFALGVIHSTRADLRLLLAMPEQALADAELSLELLTASEDPNPYVLGATVRADVQARMALGQLDDARDVGEGALSWLGDRVPQTRSLILTTLASSLRAAGQGRGGLRRARARRGARTPGVPGALRAAAEARAGDARGERGSRRAAPSWPPRTGSSPRRTRSSRCAPPSWKRSRSSFAIRPSGTGSPAFTTGATSRASSSASRPSTAGAG